VRRSWSALLVAASLALVAPTFAQTAAENDRALALGHEGLDLYNKGNWAEARVKFAEADRLAHSPVFVLYLARSARNAGDLVTARVAYDRLAAEVVPAGAPAPWTSAVESGKQELIELQKRLAEAAPPALASATPSPSTTASVPVATTTATLGNSRPIAGVARPLPEETAADRLRPVAPGLAIIGVGVIGLGVGTGMFVHAKSTADAILKRCDTTTNVCAAEDLPAKRAAVDFANGATIAAAIGGAAIATGLVLVYVLVPKQKTPGTTALKLHAGPGTVGVSGSF